MSWASTESCASIDKTAFEQSERIRAKYLIAHPLPEEDAMERIRISTLARLRCHISRQKVRKFLCGYVILLQTIHQTE